MFTSALDTISVSLQVFLLPPPFVAAYSLVLYRLILSVVPHVCLMIVRSCQPLCLIFPSVDLYGPHLNMLFFFLCSRLKFGVAHIHNSIRPLSSQFLFRCRFRQCLYRGPGSVVCYNAVSKLWLGHFHSVDPF